MRLFLLFLSSILAFCSFAASTRRHAFHIDMQKAYISGVLITNETEDVINGCMINEFGISAIDFSYSKNKGELKLINVTSFLNKWYIKRVLRNDMGFCIQILFGIPHKKKKCYEVTRSGDEVTILNTKRKMRYSFTPIEEKNCNNDTEE